MSIDRARRDVVDEDRDPDRVVHGLEVLVEPFLGRLVVVGRDDEKRVGARLLGVLCEVDRLGRVVRAGAGDDRHAPLRLIYAPFHDSLVLVMRQSRTFAGRAHGDEPLRPVLDLPAHMGPEGLLVERAVAKRGDERRERAAEPSLVGHGAPRRRASAAFAAPLHCRHISSLAAARKRPALARKVNLG